MDYCIINCTRGVLVPKQNRQLKYDERLFIQQQTNGLFQLLKHKWRHGVLFPSAYTCLVTILNTPLTR